MRLGLVIATVVAAVTALGASIAMAEGSSALCTKNVTICPPSQQVGGIHAEAGVTEIEIGMTTVLCLSSLSEGAIESANLAAPLKMKIEILTWNKCGTTAAHNNCEVSNIHLPLFDILQEKIFWNGEITVLGWELKVNCSNIFLNCVYGGNEIGPFGFSNPGFLPINGFFGIKASMPLVSGKSCPSTAAWSGEYKSLKELWLRE
jgi:hypothetical protein